MQLYVDLHFYDTSSEALQLVSKIETNIVLVFIYTGNPTCQPLPRSVGSFTLSPPFHTIAYRTHHHPGYT